MPNLAMVSIFATKSCLCHLIPLRRKVRLMTRRAAISSYTSRLPSYPEPIVAAHHSGELAKRASGQKRRECITWVWNRVRVCQNLVFSPQLSSAR